MPFETFVSKIVQAVNELEKRGGGMPNADAVEIIWLRFINAELGQYLTALKVKFQHQTLNYREIIQDIASQVSSIGFNTLWKASQVSVQETVLGGSPDQGVYDSNGLLFHGTYPETKWFSDSIKSYWEDIRRARDSDNCNSGSFKTW